MKRAICSFIFLLLIATPAIPQSTFLELGLHWGTYSGPGVANATTVLTNSTGTVIATVNNNAFPHITIPVALDVYKVTITAPAVNGNPAINWFFTMPMASVVAGIGVQSYVAAIAIDPTGTHGQIKATILANF